MADFHLMRFEDGPLHEYTRGDVQISRTMFGWPLPDRLGILAHAGVPNVAFWDADNAEASGLPEEILGSANAVIYEKVAESQLPNDDHAHVARGAVYRMEAQELMPGSGEFLPFPPRRKGVPSDSPEGGVVRSLIRVELRRTERKIEKGKERWGEDFDESRTVARRDLLRSAYRMLDGDPDNIAEKGGEAAMRPKGGTG